MKQIKKKSSNKIETNKVKSAVDYLNKGHMCSSSILMAFTEQLEIKPETAAKISFGFAGGMAQGKTCGAVTGAIMVIGLKYGTEMLQNQYSKDICSQLVQEFSHRFISRRKTLECSEILLMNNINPKDPQQMQHLREKKLCDKIVKDAAQILEDLIQEEGP